MLVPAWKNQPQAGLPNVNHYLCYRAYSPAPSGTYHGLRDEWRTDFVLLGEIEYLCAPCWKEHAGIVYPPADPLKHLALYAIGPLSELFAPFIQDQFTSGFRLVKQRRHEYVMLPSLLEVSPTATRTSTWGKVKALYR